MKVDVVVRLGGVDRMCFRDPWRMMVVVGRNGGKGGGDPAGR